MFGPSRRCANPADAGRARSSASGALPNATDRTRPYTLSVRSSRSPPIRCASSSRTTVAAFEDAVAQVPNIVQAQRLFGDPDYLLRVVTVLWQARSPEPQHDDSGVDRPAANSCRTADFAPLRRLRRTKSGVAPRPHGELGTRGGGLVRSTLADQPHEPARNVSVTGAWPTSGRSGGLMRRDEAEGAMRDILVLYRDLTVYSGFSGRPPTGRSSGGGGSIARAREVEATRTTFSCCRGPQRR